MGYYGLSGWGFLRGMRGGGEGYICDGCYRIAMVIETETSCKEMKCMHPTVQQYPSLPASHGTPR
jgi:hypothetical protein